MELTREGVEIGPNLWIRKLPIAELKEQDVNARVMAPSEFERLVENIRIRGVPESCPYCVQANGKGPIEIVSGHHRIRAARAAGNTEIAVLVDTTDYTRSQIVAKQLAHNFLAGQDDADVLNTLLDQLANPEDQLASGAPEELLQRAEHESMQLFAPHLDFDMRSVLFAFLPHQIAELEQLLDKMNEKTTDLVVVGYEDQMRELLKAAAKLARVRKVLSGGTAITLMIRLALEEVARVEALEAENEEAVPALREAVEGEEGRDVQSSPDDVAAVGGGDASKSVGQVEVGDAQSEGRGPKSRPHGRGIRAVSGQR